MKKSGSQYDSSSALPAYAEMGADTAPPRASHFSSWRIPCTAVFVTALLVAGAITTAVVHKGGPNCQQPTNGGHPHDQILDHDAVTHLQLKGRNGVTAPETMTYNSALNTVLINAPGNFSGGSPATIAIDFDRHVVFVSVHDENTCVAFALEDEMAEIAKNLIRSKEPNQVIDLVSDKAVTGKDYVVQTIPAGYVQATNGPVIRGMCSGRHSQWLETADGRMSGKQKRSITSGITFCRYICYPPDIFCCPWW
ncbi:uncharacterized protein [Diadema setosum]|uniref:uncharacterized protein n=1 Tax=Diadema setosum TaxID=31175 RepID=UPI003B3AACE4